MVGLKWTLWLILAVSYARALPIHMCYSSKVNGIEIAKAVSKKTVYLSV